MRGKASVIIDAFYILKNMLEKPLKSLQDVFLLHEAHFAIDLSEFRLPVGAQVLIAESILRSGNNGRTR
jgi:hypothetical protein